MNLSTVRNEIKTALTGVQAVVLPYVPKGIIPPAIYVIPGAPYVEPVTLGSNRFRVRFEVTPVVARTDNEACLTNIENLIFSVYQNIPANWSVTATSAPTPLDSGQAELLSCNITIETIIQAS